MNNVYDLLTFSHFNFTKCFWIHKIDIYDMYPKHIKGFDSKSSPSKNDLLVKMTFLSKLINLSEEGSVEHTILTNTTYYGKIPQINKLDIKGYFLNVQRL